MVLYILCPFREGEQMSVSIRKAFKTAYSKHYNRSNIILYAIIFGIMNLIQVLMNSKENSALVLLLFIPYIFFSTWNLGIDMIANNNAFHCLRNGVYPNPCTEILKILLQGLKHGLCSLALSFLLAIPFTIIIILITVLGNSNSVIIGAIIGLAYWIFAFIFMLSIYMNVRITLKAKSWFDFKRALYFNKKAGNTFAVWLLKELVIFIFGGIVCLILALPALVVYAINASMAFAVYWGVVCALYAILFMPVIVDLNRQLTWNVFPKLACEHRRKPVEAN